MVSPERLAAMAGAYLAGADPRAPLASPLHADLSGLPPLLVLVGGREVLYDDAIGVVEKVAAAGGSVRLIDEPEMFHVWPAFAPLLDEGQQAVEEIGRFLRAAMA
jgi:phosphinothricin tripeptide acetyl hydrolase